MVEVTSLVLFLIFASLARDRLCRDVEYPDSVTPRSSRLHAGGLFIQNRIGLLEDTLILPFRASGVDGSD
ncbi:hypothetical protein [Roseomonas chloroacetimidivorans]|uniref:hypothetical protein n=1 Tax=Roseomonas chloroacetimidivorans TaxID=1766656 RepID=UPI003C762069